MSCKIYYNFKDLNIYPKPYLYQIEYINFFYQIITIKISIKKYMIKNIIQ